MSWIKKTDSEIEDKKKEMLASIEKQKKEEEEQQQEEEEQQQQEASIPKHPYNVLHNTIKIEKQHNKQPSWLNKNTKQNIKKADEGKTIGNSSEKTAKIGWKEVSYSESLQNIAKMIKSSNENSNPDKLLLSSIINK